LLLYHARLEKARNARRYIMPAFDPSLLTPVYRTEEIREIEQRAASEPLMERAGLAAAELARDIVEEATAPVLVLAGPGNNGGDALVAARHLKEWQFDVVVVFNGDPQHLSSDAQAAHSAWRAAGGEVMRDFPAGGKWSSVIDGLFGIGLKREVSGYYHAWIEHINALCCPVLAIDIPSGLASDTGQALGETVRATHTITFIGLKPGLLTADGPEYCGRIHVAKLGLDAMSIKAPSGWLLHCDIVHASLKRRPANSHKGMYGGVGIVGGAPGMLGAALLAGRSALYMGAGRVYLGLISEGEVAVDVNQPELMLRPAESLFALETVTTLVVGPGLGQSPAAANALKAALQTPAPLVLDADALNLIGAHRVFQEALRNRSAPAILTPHPGEAARMLAVSAREIQSDRIASALDLAAKFNCCVALKGAGTVCANPRGEFYVNATGNAGMASGGMGDVLSGMIAAFIGEGAEPENALLAAVYLHGAAADDLVKHGIGPVGLTASEVARAARVHLNRDLDKRR
jgi:ADP-dependent NAD(P)H-hydrate dehydratase / NAD(P)H-hydrate epimerase